MSDLVLAFNPLEFIVDSRKAIALARWGSKCKNKKTKEKILKSSLKILKNSKFNKNAVRLVVKS